MSDADTGYIKDAWLSLCARVGSAHEPLSFARLDDLDIDRTLFDVRLLDLLKRIRAEVLSDIAELDAEASRGEVDANDARNERFFLCRLADEANRHINEQSHRLYPEGVR